MLSPPSRVACWALSLMFECLPHAELSLVRLDLSLVLRAFSRHMLSSLVLNSLSHA